MLRITQLSDPHLTSDPEGLKGFDTLARFKVCIEDALKRVDDSEKEVFILSGDIAHDESRQTYEALRDLIAATGVRWFCIPGNHDAPSLLHDVLPQQSPSVDLGWMSVALSDDLELLLLSSHLPGEVGGSLNSETLERLGRSDGQPKLVVLHHPPLKLGDPEFDAMALLNQNEFWSKVEQNSDIVGVVFGHAHRAYQEVRRLGQRDVWVLCCPSTAFQYGADNDAPYGFDSSRIGFRHIEFDATERSLRTEIRWLKP
jgi:Icc protein